MSAGPETGLSPAADQSEIRNILSSAEELMHLSRAEEALEMLQSLLAKRYTTPPNLKYAGALSLPVKKLRRSRQNVRTFG